LQFQIHLIFMNPTQKIDSLSALGDFLLSQEGVRTTEAWGWKAQTQNAWFTPENVQAALSSIATHYLNKNKLLEWVAGYDLDRQQPHSVGVVMAGNIPAAGFHDLLCVLLSGNRLMAKLSSQDSVLLKELASQLIRIEPRWQPFIEFSERLNAADAIIATGSDNSARYFRYYFGSKPHIIRQNRTSCAIIRGNEKKSELSKLGDDALLYFGLGCRNISKLFVPSGYDFTPFFESIEHLNGIIHHAKYQNNYDYNKSIYLVNRVSHLDNGFLLLTPNEALVSPVSVLYYEEYLDLPDLQEKINSQRNKLQCIVSGESWFPGSLPLGTAQSPALSDYADGIDTLAFLMGLAASKELF
jgi:hypothetical protein